MSVPLKSKLGCNHLIIGELQPNRLIFNMSVQMRFNPLLQPAPLKLGAVNQYIRENLSTI
jgi:hypothetical protein